ncbi:NADH-quinone oxidoreductase subunit A [Demequina sp. B12]|uniref:NADH-quinone oxidoreductase subunit A n=1 Tax=Demequina sp. B12 TaxID=2992757 RepID=UPI00237C02E2|nr:NADH-quinone oxidoreductase subunit A [Demequina sp. B12]MDE0572361.1 NADH-quinone oxidoreductase subunit A [Demequina sp. B12]
MNPYVPIVVMICVAAAMAVAGLIISSLTGPKRYNSAKVDQYESGLQPTPGATGGGRVPIKYYLVAMTFIVFDIEVVFLYPWAVAHDALGWFGLIATMTFLALITIPFVYEWRRGGFEWD